MRIARLLLKDYESSEVNAASGFLNIFSWIRAVPRPTVLSKSFLVFVVVSKSVKYSFALFMLCEHGYRKFMRKKPEKQWSWLCTRQQKSDVISFFKKPSKLVQFLLSAIILKKIILTMFASGLFVHANTRLFFFRLPPQMHLSLITVS